MHEPLRRLLGLATEETRAEDPVAPAARILDAVVVARAARARRTQLAPPFGRDALRPLRLHDAMAETAPGEAGGRAFRHLGNDADRLRPAQQERRTRRQDRAGL